MSAPRIAPTALYDARRFGRLLGVDVTTARRFMREGADVLRPAKIGSRRYVLGSDVLRWFETRRRSA